MTLPNDVCRCASKTCPRLLDCARSERIPQAPVATFYPFSDFTPRKGDECVMFIPNVKG